MELAHAHFLADSVVAKLKPVCERVMICGGVRRHKPEPHDLDIVCQPRRDAEKDMFGNITGRHVIPEFITCVNQWTKIKGEPFGRYTQRLLKDGTHLEISIAQPDNWGNLVVIRTGDEEFVRMLMIRALKIGLRQQDGFLWNDDRIIPIKEEADYFRMLNLPYIEPQNRNKDAFK